jgi:hypothetical protein
VVFFDEFERILFHREGPEQEPASVFAFLTTSMLPKLARLYDAAKKNSFVYVMATNYEHKLDDAAIRNGRFDRRVFVHDPDVASRACRLVSQWARWRSETAEPGPDAAELQTRAARIVMKTGSLPVEYLARPGVLTKPKGGSAASPVWNFLVTGTEEPEFPVSREAPTPTPSAHLQRGGLAAEMASTRDWRMKALGVWENRCQHTLKDAIRQPRTSDGLWPALTQRVWRGTTDSEVLMARGTKRA